MSFSIHRLILWNRDRTCFVCSKVIESFFDSTVEHVVPRSKGGSDRMSNLALSHARCNNLRGNSTDREEWMARLEKGIPCKVENKQKTKAASKNRKIKKKLWESRPICFFCFQHIDDFEDVCLEFVTPLAKGGTYHENNIAISHSWCHSARGDLESQEEVLERLGHKFCRWMKAVGKRS